MNISVQLRLKVDTTHREVTTIFGKKVFAVLASFGILLAAGFAVSAIAGYAVVGNAAAQSPTQNLTSMISDLMPSFFYIMFVMVFVLMLLVILDRVAKHV